MVDDGGVFLLLHANQLWPFRASEGSRSRACCRGPPRQLKTLERENRELRQANEILRKARLFCPGGARPPVQAMIAFIDDHRQAYGVEPICKVMPIAPSDLSCPCRKAGRSRQAIGAGAAGRDPQGRDPACLRGELRRLWRAQGLAAIAPRGRGYRPMHRGATDAEHGPARRDPRQAGQNHDQRQGRAVSAGSCQPPVPGAQAERALGLGLQCAAASGVRDGGRSPAIGLQEQVANHRKRLWSKAGVVSVTEKALQRRQVGDRKANTREPPFKCRKCSDDVETGE